MGRLGNFVRSLTPGNDHELAATQYAGQESASDRAARKEAVRAETASRKRREAYRTRVFRDGDNSSERIPRRYRNHNSASN
jgi:hypothetical protein